MLVIFDSGIGGFELLSKVETLKPNSSILYYTDAKNFPYGNKTKREIEKTIKTAFNHFEQQRAKGIVLACNTASSVSKELFPQDEYNGIPILGTINSLRKIAENEESLDILSTALSAKYLKQDKTFQKHNIIPLENLASLIEQNDLTRAEDYIKHIVPTTQDILYACTHFPLIHDLFVKILGPKKFHNPIDDMVDKLTSYAYKEGTLKFWDKKHAQDYKRWKEKISKSAKYCLDEMQND